MSARAARLVFACTLKPPSCATRCGVRPTWAITAMPLSTSARTVSTTSWPPSTLTASIPASLRKRAALCNASVLLAWYDPNGMSPTRSGRCAPRDTAAACRTMSSIVTGTVIAAVSDDRARSREVRRRERLDLRAHLMAHRGERIARRLRDPRVQEQRLALAVRARRVDRALRALLPIDEVRDDVEHRAH